MRTPDLIQRKRDGGALSRDEINWLITNALAGRVPDYQISAFLMAVYFRGMSSEETKDLTLAMADSGHKVDLSAIPGVKVDKHSTGGVADTTTLIVAPLVAAAGVPVAKMSGRGLGHTGGTVDKLESIPGFRTSLSPEEFIDNVVRIGIGVVGQTADVAPADKMLYAIRDVTATVDSIPLIASSIMSKKIATGADAIVLDVKTGSGAFMRDVESATVLAELMVDIGRLAGRRTVALISDMSQPLGHAVGNSLEVVEAVEVLQGRAGGRLRDLSLELGAWMILLGGKAKDIQQAREIIRDLLETGAGLRKFRELVAAQGGDPRVADDPSLLPVASISRPIVADMDGYVRAVDALTLGRAAMALGAGRAAKEDVIDPSVGLVTHVMRGSGVRRGDVVATVYANDDNRLQQGFSLASRAFEYSAESVEPVPLVHAVIA